jgi:hypothetical protein
VDESESQFVVEISEPSNVLFEPPALSPGHSSPSITCFSELFRPVPWSTATPLGNL